MITPFLLNVWLEILIEACAWQIREVAARIMAKRYGNVRLDGHTLVSEVNLIRHKGQIRIDAHHGLHGTVVSTGPAEPFDPSKLDGYLWRSHIYGER